MAFVCNSESDARKRMKKLEEIREVMKLVEDKMRVRCVSLVPADPCPLPCTPCVPCPPPPCPQIEEDCQPPPEPPKVMVCYKVTGKSKNSTKNAKTDRKSKRLKKSKSRELRASILHVGCDCEKRNGLQDDCQRSECHGSPECLVKPDPICGPSEYAGGKHLGKNRYDLLKKNGNGDDNEDIDNDDGTVTAKYRCYPAAITEIRL